MMKLVNSVGGGNIGTELDLTELQIQLPISSEYEPEQHPGLYFKIPETGVTTMLFRSGEYHLSGGKSIEQLRKTRDILINMFTDYIPELDEQDTTFEVRNLVYTGNVGQELELSELAIGLGLNVTEYNPEQFPGLIYSTEKFEGTFLIFRSGNVILTGCKNKDSVKNSFEKMEKTLNELLINGDD